MAKQKSRMQKSLKVSLTFVFSAFLLIIVVLGFTGGLNMASFQQNYTKSLVSSYAVSGGETLRKIEYAVKYGKQLDNFYGIEELLQERMSESSDLEQARIVLTDGQVIYNQDGPLLNETVSNEIIKEIDFNTTTDLYSFVQDDGRYHVFLPIRDGSDTWVGSLALVFDEQIVKQFTQEYISKLLMFLVLMALIAAVSLIIFVFRSSIFTDEGQLQKKRLLVGILIILSAVQIVYGFINYQVFRDAYVQTAEENTIETARVVQKDIEFVVNNGVPYSKLFELENYLSKILSSVPEIASISITGTSHDVLYTTLDGEEIVSDIEERWMSVNQLTPDLEGIQPSLQVQLSSEYVRSKLNSIILDTLTVLVTSFLFMVEITLLVLIFLRKRVGNTQIADIVDDSKIGTTNVFDPILEQAAASEEKLEKGITNNQNTGGIPSSNEEDGSIIRPLIFILSIAVFMSSAFIPIVMKKLYEAEAGGFFGLSQSVAVALPLSVEMLCAGLATILAGYLVDQRGWKPVFFIGMIFLASGMLLSGFASNGLIFVIARGIAGVGYGLSFMAMRGYVNTARTEKARTDGVSSLLAGLYAGINCGVIVGAMLADRIGFAQVFFVAVCIVIIACLFAFLFIENRKPIDQESEKTGQKIKRISVFSFLTNPKIFGFFLLVVVPIAICSMFLDYYFPVYAESIGVSTSDVGRAFLVNGLFIVYLGPFLSKYIAKYFSTERSILLAGLIVVGAMAVFAVSGSLWAAFVAVILLGISDSFGLVAQNNYYVKLKAANQIGIGKALGYYDNVRKIGQMLGPMVISVLLFAGTRGIGILGVAFLATLFIFWLVTKMKDGSHIERNDGVDA